MILTLDLGTTRTKAVLWDGPEMVASGDATVATTHPAPGRAEQDPAEWWGSVVAACGAVRTRSPEAYGAVAAVGFAAARQTFVPVTSEGTPLGTGIVWSDRRGSADGSVAGKVAWLRAHEPARLAAARWLMAPRDLVAWRLTGVAATDVTLASAAGVDECLLPEVLAPDAVMGTVATEELGLRVGTPVVIGAGDRQCEVLASGASPTRPMVSWGTTANVSIPLDRLPDPVPAALLATRGGRGGWLLEGGLAAAGSLVDWVAGLTGVPVARCVAGAAAAPPGARGIVAVPWLGGARAPWWRPDTGAGFLGLGPGHTAGDLTRAVLEAVAADLARCLEASGTTPGALMLAGGAANQTWVEILTGVVGLPAVRRRCADTASVGAALLVTGIDVDVINPVVGEVAPALAGYYRAWRPVSDAATAAALTVPPTPGFTVSR